MNTDKRGELLDKCYGCGRPVDGLSSDTWEDSCPIDHEPGIEYCDVCGEGGRGLVFVCSECVETGFVQDFWAMVLKGVKSDNQ